MPPLLNCKFLADKNHFSNMFESIIVSHTVESIISVQNVMIHCWMKKWFWDWQNDRAQNVLNDIQSKLFIFLNGEWVTETSILYNYTCPTYIRCGRYTGHMPKCFIYFYWVLILNWVPPSWYNYIRGRESGMDCLYCSC